MNVLENVLETSASLATHFKVEARTIRRDLSVLQTKGFIRHNGPDNGGRRVVKRIIESFITRLTRITNITEYYALRTPFANTKMGFGP